VGSGRYCQLVKEAHPKLVQNKKAAEVMSAAFGKFLRNEIPAPAIGYYSARPLWIPGKYGVLICHEECPNEGQHPKSGAGLFDPQRPDFEFRIGLF
jgi:hypothetical protein